MIHKAIAAGAGSYPPRVDRAPSDHGRHWHAASMAGGALPGGTRCISCTQQPCTGPVLLGNARSKAAAGEIPHRDCSPGRSTELAEWNASCVKDRHSWVLCRQWSSLASSWHRMHKSRLASTYVQLRASMEGMAERWWFAPEHNDSVGQSFKKTEPKKSLQVLCPNPSLWLQHRCGITASQIVSGAVAVDVMIPDDLIQLESVCDCTPFLGYYSMCVVICTQPWGH